jgi:hypothetical protein
MADASVDAPIAICPTIGQPTQLGHIENEALSELSGLASSDGFLLAHDDNKMTIHVVERASGEISATLVPVSGSDVVPGGDIEDIAVAGGFVFIGDIGSAHSGTTGRVARFTMPTAATLAAGGIIDVSTEVMQFEYTVGDAESMIVDPRTNEVFLITKRSEPQLCSLGLFANGTTVTPVCSIMTSAIKNPSAADFDRTGRFIVVRNEFQTGIFLRQPGMLVADAVRQAPCPFPTLESDDECNGEAIAFSSDGRTIFSGSERGSLGGNQCPDTHLHEYEVVESQ